MSSNTTASERLLEVSNKLWDAMYESGEVPTYAERAHYYLALKDAMDENAELQETLQRRTEQFDGMTEMWVERGVESAKLRELVHVLLQCRVEGDDICAKCNYRSPLHGGCMADVKADELGVEVDDG